MSNPKYKFSIDEPKPNIPAPRDFSKLLSSVKVKVPWYAKGSFWGGMTTALVAAVAGVYWFSSNPNTEVLLSKNYYKNANATAETKENRLAESFQEKTANDQSPFAFKVTETLHSAVNGPEATMGDIIPQLLPIQKEIPFENTTALATLPSVFPKLPYDTFWISAHELPKVLNLKRGGKLVISKSSVVESNGKPVTGIFMVLFREILTQSDMLLTSMYMETTHLGDTKPLINNGSFEVRLEQNGQALSIKNDMPLIMHAQVLKNDKSGSGYFAYNTTQAFSPMFVSAITDDAAEQNMKLVSDRMMIKRNFWQWLGDLFTGRKIRWDSFDRVEPVTFKDSAADNFRNFELRTPGVFASATPMQLAFSSTSQISVSSEGNNPLGLTIYQVFLNKNVIRQYPLLNGQAQVNYNKDDRCILLAVVENSRFLAVLDANSFDRIVKHSNNGEISNLVFKVVPNSITSPQDLKNLISSYSKQRPGRD